MPRIVSKAISQMEEITCKSILYRIAELQSKGDRYYAPGIFPSQRVQSSIGYVREDNNIFFSALVVFTLNRLLPWLNPPQAALVSDISKKVVANYPDYLHKESPDTYNFWRSDKQSHFPHGWLLHRVSKLALAADTDDTSLIYLTQPDMKVELLIREYQQQYPGHSPSSPLTPSAYRDLKAYPTFLGKRMGREMDACVICNVLFLVFKYQLPLTEIDYDSLEFLKRVLQRQDHLHASFQVSPNYANGATILYHITRLIAAFEQDMLSDIRDLTLENLISEVKKPQPFMELLLLKSSLARLGVPTPALPLEQVAQHFEKFYYFRAGMLTGLQIGLLKNLAPFSFFHLKYRCEAYYWALVMEYLVLSENG